MGHDHGPWPWAMTMGPPPYGIRMHSCEQRTVHLPADFEVLTMQIKPGHSGGSRFPSSIRFTWLPWITTWICCSVTRHKSAYQRNLHQKGPKIFLYTKISQPDLRSILKVSYVCSIDMKRPAGTSWNIGSQLRYDTTSLLAATRRCHFNSTKISPGPSSGQQRPGSWGSCDEMIQQCLATEIWGITVGIMYTFTYLWYIYL